MTYPDDIHLIFRNARRAAGLTQAALAEQAGCMQSAISMMESGRMDALSSSTIEKIASILGVVLEAPEAAGGTVQTLPQSHPRFCPNPECPSCFPYLVGRELFFLPQAADAGAKYCHLCGEVLLESCPACGAPCPLPSACCRDCGQALITPPPTLPPPEYAGWLRRRREIIGQLQQWQGRSDQNH